MSSSSFLAMLFWIFVLRLLRKKTSIEKFNHSIDVNKIHLHQHQLEALQNFSNNKLKQTRKRSVYLHQYYVNEEPIYGNHNDYYLNYLGDLSPTEITVSTLKKAYQNTIVYPHKCKSTAKAAAKYLKDRSIYLTSMN